MSAIHGQTAKPNGLTFFKEANGYPRGNKGKKFSYNSFYVKIKKICSNRKNAEGCLK